MKKMTNFGRVFACLCAAALVFSGCGASDEKAENVTELKVGNYISLGDYKNLTVTVPAPTVDEEYVDYLVSNAFSSGASYVGDEVWITDRAVQNGDMINLDYSGKKDGVVFDGGTAENQTLWIGSHTFIDGFEDGLIGVNPGETVDLDLTFPENYGNADLAGAAVVFTCTVNGIIPEDEIYTAVGEYLITDAESPIGDEESLREYFRNYLLASQNTDEDIRTLIVEQLLNIVTVEKEFPSAIVLAYQNSYKETLEYYAQSYGTDADSFATDYIGMSASEYIQDMSYDQLRLDAACALIAEKEGFLVDDKELDQRLADYAAQNGVTVDDILKNTSKEEARVSFMEQDVLDYLVSIVNVTEQQ
jgi:trigger factor